MRSGKAPLMSVPSMNVWPNCPSWKRCMEIRARLMEEQDLQWNGVPKRYRDFY
ncbi:uncharacterized protein F4817DRAFT_352900 [Daldinia loculata]|uniref:uncharacterized protein n=1 Tax=Daldinia loculata TaxID=103429 RepID=UPI0020C58CA6|nr:uncharacterized protein F4817DRAFT_352900 [Daldinia loculata]KAI1642463.1 hypothetical protein F4817DRAFT_352900 [Daldinia loculata]